MRYVVHGAGAIGATIARSWTRRDTEFILIADDRSAGRDGLVRHIRRTPIHFASRRGADVWTSVRPPAQRSAAPVVWGREATKRLGVAA